MTLARFLALAAACIGGTAQAQPYETPPAPGPMHDLAIATPFEHTLPNGLRVVVARRPGIPLVTTQLVVTSGSETDPPARAGRAALTAALLVKGTKRHSAPQIAQAAEALGGSLDSGAGWHAASVGITVTTPRLPQALALLSEVVREPAFAQSELDRARRQALDGLRVALADPGRLAGLVSARAVFGDSAYGQLRGGTPASLARLTRTDLVRAHATAYRADNAVLIFAGEIEPAQALRLARRYFGDWARPGSAAPAATVAPARPAAATLIAVDLPDAGQAGIVVAAPSIARSAPDWTAGQVANAVLGHGYSSRLNQQIRIKRGLSYGAASVLDARRAGGVFAASTQTKNESAAEVVGILRAEIARLADAPPDAAELAARKANLIGDYSRSLETTGGLAANVAALVIGAAPLTELGRRIPQIESVQPQQVQDFAAAHWRAADLRTVVVGDLRRVGAALRANDPQAFVIPHDRLDLDRADLAAPPH